MFLNMVIHEIRQNIANIRFSAGTVLCAVLTLVCVGILSQQYTREFDDYRACLAAQDEFVMKYAHTNRINSAIYPQKPPAQLRPFITPLQLPQEFPGESIFQNPFTRFFPSTDLIFIVSVIMSLMAILFSYDAVSGDRERGTLRLLLTNPLSRPALIAAKWLGGLFTLTVPFALSLLIGAIYVILHPGIHWESGSIATLVLLLAASIVYISAFYLMGLMVSSRTAHSSVSILVSLFIWVFFILVIPNVSPYITAQIYRVPSATKYERMRYSITNVERDELGRELYHEALLKLLEKYGHPLREYLSMLDNTSNSDARKRIASDPQLQAIHAAHEKAREDAWAEANRMQKEKADALDTDYQNRVDTQERITRAITGISPYADFLYLATDLAGTGIHANEHFTDSVRAYYGELTPYIEKKEREARENDPLYDTDTFLDISDRPRFTYREEPLTARLYAVRWHGALLVVFNVLFFAGAFVSFLRYDVR